MTPAAAGRGRVRSFSPQISGNFPRQFNALLGKCLAICGTFAGLGGCRIGGGVYAQSKPRKSMENVPMTNEQNNPRRDQQSQSNPQQGGQGRPGQQQQGGQNKPGQQQGGQNKPGQGGQHGGQSGFDR